jgi:hypothetical protein
MVDWERDLKNGFASLKSIAPFYFRLAAILIVAGIGIITPGFRDLIIEFLRSTLGLQPYPNAPYWVGIFLVAAGIFVFSLGFGRRSASSGSDSGWLAFKINYANGSRKFHRLPRNSSLRIGRGRDNDLILKDEYVSKYHCVIEVHEDHVEVSDLAAHNPIKFNGIRARRGILFINDSMTLGQTELVVVRNP